MKIFTTYISNWSEEHGAYIPDLDKSVYFDYSGEVALCCGATPGQTEVGNTQSAAYTQMVSQASQQFGQASGVFNDLISSFAPTVAAGPDQEGFSAGELSNLNSEAITQTGQAYKNAKAAAGDANAAVGGGNVNLPGGAKVGTNDALAVGAADQTASELGQIKQADYTAGKQNYNTAVTGLENAPGVFGTSNQAGEAATGSGTAASNTQNQIATQDDSWVNAVTGALGSVAGVATGGIIKNYGAGSGGGSGGGDTSTTDGLSTPNG